MKQKQTTEGRNSSTIIDGEFNTPHLIMDKTTRQNIKETEDSTL